MAALEGGIRVEKPAEKAITISFIPDFGLVDLARAAITGVCRASFPGPEAEPAADELALAVAEAMNNAVEHSGTDQVTIKLSVFAEKMVFEMRTRGRPFDPTADVSMPELEKDGETREGGWGRALVKELTDDFRYEYAGGFNVLTLEKKFRAGAKEGRGGN